MGRAKFIGLVAVVGAMLGATQAQASEKGGDAYPNGAETLASAAFPPPGVYLLNYTEFYSAGRLNDDSGHSALPGFKLDAYAEVPRFIWITPQKILGATLAVQIFTPLVSLTVHANGQRDSRFGLGDIIVNPFVLGWKIGNNHIVVTPADLFVPVGSYKKDRLANIGRNYWTFEPAAAWSYYNPKGGPEASVKVMYDFNTKNGATDYKSGQAFHTDFALGYDFNPVSIGLDGYWYKQTTNDKQYGLKVGPDGFRGETFALGPMVRYQAGVIPVTLQWQHELKADNRPQGDRFWIKAAFRF